MSTLYPTSPQSCHTASRMDAHMAATGKPVKHALAKEVLAGFVGAEVDKLIETKGLDEIDKIRAHEHAKKNAEQMYVDYYEKEHAAEEYDPERYPAPSRW